jgi:hypothetical protein
VAKNLIDFSSYDDSFSSEKYWTPASTNYNGHYGYAETQYAYANYFQIGDVGDPDWRQARRLPFGDEALEALYPGNRSISFLQYAWEHPDADTDNGNPVKSYIEADPALEWALTEMSKLPQDSERYKHLAKFVAEARDYENRQIEEEAFIHAPSWAMDAIIYAQENAYSQEQTKIIEDFSPKSSQSAKVISSSPYMDQSSLKTYANVHEEYTVKLKKPIKSYCFALKNNQKVYGPYGDTYSAFKLYKGPSSWDSEAQTFKVEQMYKLLNESGIVPVFNSNQKLTAINHKPITADNVQEARANYSNLASAIHEANFITGTIVQHIRDIQDDIFWELLNKHIKLNKLGLEYKAILNQAGIGYTVIRQVGREPLRRYIEDFTQLESSLEQKVSTNYYVMTIGKDTVVGITSEKQIADMFKTGDSEDILYILLPKYMREKIGSPEEIRNMYGYDSKEHKAWRGKAIGFLTSDSGKHTTVKLQEIVSLYNTNRKVKTVLSKASREYGWLLGELPYNREHIKTMSDCLEAYGRAIIAFQQKTPAVKSIYARIKSLIEYKLAKKEIPTHVKELISQGKSIAFVYDLRRQEVPTGTIRQEMLNANLISQLEISSGSYLKIDLHWDYVFTNPSDVFRYVSNFNPSLAAVRLASGT